MLNFGQCSSVEKKKKTVGDTNNQNNDENNDENNINNNSDKIYVISQLAKKRSEARLKLPEMNIVLASVRYPVNPLFNHRFTILHPLPELYITVQ